MPGVYASTVSIRIVSTASAQTHPSILTKHFVHPTPIPNLGRGALLWLAGMIKTNEQREGRRNLSKLALDICWGLLGFLSCLRASEATTPERASEGNLA